MPLSARGADLEDRLGDESVAEMRTRLDPPSWTITTPSDTRRAVPPRARLRNGLGRLGTSESP